MMNAKRNAELTKIRGEDGAQRYRFGPGLNDIVWLCGPDRAQGARVGDRGDLVYSSDGSRGRWTFRAKEKR